MKLMNRVGFHKQKWPNITLMREVVFLTFFCFLILFSSGAYAVDYVCSDCHTPQHGPCPDCIGCHTSKVIKYPMGPGMSGVLTDSTTCVTCHLAGATAQAVHAGVPMDIQASCGQCHGGSAGWGGTSNGAGYRSESYLSMVATGMHMTDDPPSSSARYSITVNITPPLGKNTHFVLKKCTTTGCSTKENGKAVDAYTFKAHNPGDWKVRVYRKDQGYDCESTGKPKVNVTTVDVDVTVTCAPTP